MASPPPLTFTLLQVTYELQPLSYTSLRLLSGPPRGGGGDTLWASHYGAYDLLSPQMQKYLESLTALHSADLQADGSRAAGRPLRREPITTEHPLVRTHPVTGWKSLFYSPGFITVIVGIPKTESDAIIRYLSELISTTQEIHARFQWQQYDVAFWDNRVTVSRSYTLRNCFGLWDLPRANRNMSRATRPLTDSHPIVDMPSASAVTVSGHGWIRRGGLRRKTCTSVTDCRRSTRMGHGSRTTTTSGARTDPFGLSSSNPRAQVLSVFRALPVCLTSPSSSAGVVLCSDRCFSCCLAVAGVTGWMAWKGQGIGSFMHLLLNQLRSTGVLYALRIQSRRLLAPVGQTPLHSEVGQSGDQQRLVVHIADGLIQPRLRKNLVSAGSSPNQKILAT